MSQTTDVTPFLAAAGRGDREAFDAVVPVVYGELQRIAHQELAREQPGHTLDTSALVHEVYLKLARLDRIEWQNREHFFGVAARVTRQVLVDYAVKRKAQKRGGGAIHVPLEDAPAAQLTSDILALDEALAALENLDERQARVVEYRFFGGLSIEETARALGVSPATVKRDWTLARAFLNRELSR